MGLRIQQLQRLQRLQGLPRYQLHRTLSQSPRFVHSSSRRDVSVPSTSTPRVASELLPEIPPTSQPKLSKKVLSRLPTSIVLRSYLISGMSSSPLLLSFCLKVLQKMLKSKSYLMNIERNKFLSKALKSTLYAQFCAGESNDEVVKTVRESREVLGYDGVILEYALEMIEGAEPTAEETAQEIEVWKQGNLRSIEVAKEGDFIGLKWSGLGRRALHLLRTEQDATPEMWEAINAACDLAAAKGVGLLPSAEEEATNKGLDKWTLALQRKHNTIERGRAIVYITYQCYLKSICGRLAQHLEMSQNEGYIAGVKLVRGAYLATEPREFIWDTKEGTDKAYDDCAEAVLKREWTDVIKPSNPNTPFPEVSIVIATHNDVSVKKAQQIRAEQLRISSPESLPHLAYAQLHGMADEISQAIAQDVGKQADTRSQVVKFMAWGTTTECLNYLLRRASENKEAASRTIDTRKAMGAELWRRLTGVFRTA